MSTSLRWAMSALVVGALATGCGNEARNGGSNGEDAASGDDAGAGDVGVDDVSFDIAPTPDGDLPDAGEDTVSPPDVGVDTVVPPDTGEDTISPPDIGVDTVVPPDTGCVDECGTPGASCEGDVLRTCERGPEGCLVASSIDCAASFGTTCDPDTLTCAGDDPLPCEDRETCPRPGRTCDGDTVVVCSEDADGCLVPATIPCDLLDQTCVASDGTASCEDPTDPCLGECPAASYCSGGDAITCEEDADGCLVETAREPCADEGLGCVEIDGEAICAGSCADVDTCDPDDYATSCDGAVFLSCGPDRDGCFIEQGQNCAFRRGGFCDPVEGCGVDLCGDGAVDAEIGERCDDGNRTSGDGCSDACGIEDGFVCAGAPSVCTPLACGDDEVAFGEGCEDGNTRAGDGCSPECLLEIPDRGEVLAIDGSLIEASSTWESPNPGCTEGGFPTEFEASWWSNDTGSPQSVSVEVTTAGGEFLELAVFDGDWLPGQEPTGCIEVAGFGGPGGGSSVQDIPVAPGEGIAIIVSRFGGGGGGGFPNYTVTVTSAGCGDGRVQTELGEVCDDGGSEDGDGCDASCELETGFACRGEPSECYAFACGDGLVDEDVGEACDDGGTEDGDGCSADCAVEDGAFCFGEPSTCVNPVCGDDVIELGEGCEDGNLTNGDGCNDVCQLEIPAPDETVEISDVFTGAEPEYERPGQGEGCDGGFSGTGSDYPWIARTWVNTSDVDVVIDIVATWPGDGFLHVYDGGFDPANPLARCLFGDDDEGGIRGSALRNIPVRAGAVVTVVASSFSPGGIVGEFSITVTAR